jgi:glycine oxidase
MPSIGRVPEREGLWMAAGHGRNGVLLAPITAELIRDELLGKTGSESPPPWCPGR